jgi:TolB-like protein/tetratricopeptide (TPR) repeat protein
MTGTLAAVLGAELADRYRIEAEVGRGSVATVFLAQDLRHGRRVALKVLHSALGAALGAERFQREIRTQARLHHPHILTLFDSGAGGQGGGGAEWLWYTMPFVESGSLRDRLQREGRLPVETAVRLATQVCSALTYAHALGVVHRDIKPENILLSVSGHALLSDFGIAYAVDDSAVPGAARRLTETGVALGTPAYMSPEQSAGDEPVDARSDIYSLAGVLFEMLAGTPPFTGPNARAVIARRLTEPPPSVGALRPDVPAWVDAALRRAMARQPGDRFESATEFAAALTLPAEPGPPPPVVTPTPSAAWGKGTKRHFAPFPHAALGVRVTITVIVAVVAVAAGVYAARRLRSDAPAAVPVAAGPRMLAVLPFKNLGDSADQYFADGVTEEVTSRLAGLSGLRVISRTSADQYRDSEKSLKDIASDLGAGYLLAGSVRYARGGAGAGRVRVTPQLIDISDDTQLWTESFEVELGDIFRVQSEIAERVTAQLDVTLRGPERAALAGGGTRNPEAYDFYLRGNDYLGRSNQETDLTNAARLFQQAVAADPGFAVAYAKLARCHTQIYWHHYDHTTRRLTLARQALDSAVRIGPELPETHMALGYWHYWARLDYESALREFGAALRLQPSNSELLQAMGYVERRRGRWEESLAHFVEALRYDPRSGVRSFDVGDNYLSLRMFGEADHYLDRATALSSDWANPYLYRAWLQVIWRGDLARARAIVGQGLNRIEAGRFALSLQTGDRVSASIVTADSTFWPMLDALSRGNWSGDPARYHLLKAETAAFRDDRAAERAHGDSAVTIIEGRTRAQPDDAKVLSALALAYSHAGRQRDAVRAGERSAELLPVAQDAVSGPFILSYLARVYMAAGRHDDAVRLLGELIGIPSWISRPALRADPLWDPLRRHPGFARLVEDSPST